MLWLRQSTASQEILLGPFLDDTDGKTAETALTIANTDIKIWVEGGTTEASKTSGGATHISAGRYYTVLDATDSATLGKMEINVHVAGALPVRREFLVLSAIVYDSLVLASDTLQTDLIQLSGDATSLSDFKDFVDNGYDPPTNKILGVVTTDAIGSAGITEASFSTTAGSFMPLNIIDCGTAQSATSTTLVLRAAAAFANDEIIGATIRIRTATAGVGQSRIITDYDLATDTATVDAWTTTPTGTITYDIFGTAKGSVETSPVNVTQLLGTAWLTPAVAGTPDVNAKQFGGAAVTATTSVTFAAASTVASTTNITAGTITTATNLTNLPAITAGWITAAGIADSAIDRATFAVDTGMRTLRSGTCQSGSTSSTVVLDAGASSTTDFYRGDLVHLTSGTGDGEHAMITAYNGTTKTATIDATWTSTPTSGTTFALRPGDATVAMWGASKTASAPLALVAGRPSVDVAIIQNGIITANTIANAAIDAATFAADAITAIQAGLSTQASVDTIDGIVDAILIDTAEIGAAGAGLTALATQSSVNTLNNLSAAQVNAEVLDVLNVDTFTEETGVPAATSSLRKKIGWMFMWFRNKVTQTGTTSTLFADDGSTTVGTHTVSDDATTFTSGEGA